MARRMQTRWTLKWCSFFASVAAIALTSTDHVAASHQDCSANDQHRLLLLVSTLDGKVTAINMEDGKAAWSINTGSGPLVSSSISKLEINKNGVPTKLIPSLDGGLYQFDGVGLEPVPMAADLLLSSSFRFNDNSMVVGGKERETYGIDLQTGKVKYICSMNGCQKFEGQEDKVQKGDRVPTNESVDEVLVITRNTKTVRTVEMKSGNEKWNFSVGSHEVSFISSRENLDIQRHIGQDKGEREEPDVNVDGCTVEEEPEEGYDYSWFHSKFGKSEEDIDFKVIVPKGLVVAFSKQDPDKTIWEHKSSAAIASAWILRNEEMSEVDLFDDKHIPALTSEETGGNGEVPCNQDLPLLYIGVHEKQLYVQPSVKMSRDMKEAAAEAIHHGSLLHATMPYIQWRPYLATAPSRTPIVVTQKPPPQLTWEHEQDPSADTSLSVWHKEYPYDEGYYLFPEKTTIIPSIEGNQSSEYTGDIFIDNITVTMWHWWKEIVAITILTAVITHFCTLRCLMRYIRRHPKEMHRLTDSLSQGCVTETSKKSTESEQVEEGKEAVVQYVSRYYTDFNQDTCLGRGGFGVVFQARNKLDDCEYAIKRITLNKSERAKEKVMREVKALAKLDHVGIVRYYQAWFESPPMGWQEERDRLTMEVSSTSAPTQEYSVTEYSPGASNMHSRWSANSSPKSTEAQKKSVPDCANSNFDNPLKPYDVQFTLSGDSVSQDSGQSQHHVRKVSSEGFIPHCDSSLNDFNEENDSFSLGVSSIVKSHSFKDDESFSIVFQNNNSCSSGVNELPFGEYKQTCSQMTTEDSMDIVFEDSGCDEKSKSVEMWDDQDHAIIDCSVSQSDSKQTGKPDPELASREDLASRETSPNSLALRPNSLAVQKDETSVNDKKTIAPHPKLYLYIQMQLCKKESLKDWLCEHAVRERYDLLQIYDQIVSAMDYVHQSGLMHRDLKPSNIFFAMDGTVKIGDFGLVTALEENCEYTPLGDGPLGFSKHTDQVGTKLYMSPEQSEGRAYTHKVDIYALGMIFVELYCPFSTQMERIKTLVEVRRLLFPAKFRKEYPMECSFVTPLLSPDPERRPSTSDILMNPLLVEHQACNQQQNMLHKRNGSRTRTFSTSSSLGSMPLS